MSEKKDSDSNFNSFNEKHFTDSQFKTIQKQKMVQSAAQQAATKQTPLKLNSFNYQRRPDKDDLNHPTTLVGKLRKRLRPVLTWFRHIHYEMEDSSRRRRRIWFGGLIGGMVISALVGVLWTKGIIVNNTPIGHAKTFINADKIAISREEYDPHNDIARIDLTTSSNSGVISPKNLTAQFLFAKQPKQKSHLLAPTIQMIPTFDNHFVAVVRHLYPGYQGMKVQFKDHSDITVGTLASALQSQSDGEPADSNDFKSTHMGAFYLNQHYVNMFSSYADGDASKQPTDSQQRQMLKVSDYVEKHNTQDIVMKESSLKHHEHYIDPSLTSTEVADQEMRTMLKHKQADIKTKELSIKKDQPLIKQDRDKMRSMNRDSNIDPNNNSKIEQTVQQLNSTKQEISSDKSTIDHDNQDIKNIRNRWNQINNGIITMPKPQHQDTALKFSKYHNK